MSEDGASESARKFVEPLDMEPGADLLNRACSAAIRCLWLTGRGGASERGS